MDFLPRLPLITRPIAPYSAELDLQKQGYLSTAAVGTDSTITHVLLGLLAPLLASHSAPWGSERAGKACWWLGRYLPVVLLLGMHRSLSRLMKQMLSPLRANSEPCLSQVEHFTSLLR